jgi:hypothetical protein
MTLEAQTDPPGLVTYPTGDGFGYGRRLRAGENTERPFAAGFASRSVARVAAWAHYHAARPGWINVAEVAPGSVIEHDPDVDGDTMTVRLQDGTGWHCLGDDCDLLHEETGWRWSMCGFPLVRVMVAGLTAEEAREVAGLDGHAARAWCARRS